MKLYDITALRCEYVKPETDLTAWGEKHRPFAMNQGNISAYSESTGCRLLKLP